LKRRRVAAGSDLRHRREKKQFARVKEKELLGALRIGALGKHGAPLTTAY
jgi:hypothetical protein